MAVQTKWSRIVELLKPHRLLLSVLIGVVLGCVIGISCHDAVQNSPNPSPRRLAMYIKFPGELFIRMLKLIVIPLITSSIIVALNDIDIKSAGRLGKRTMIYYISTTMLSAILGLVLASIIKPGSGVNEEKKASDSVNRNSVDSFLDLLRNVFPDNLMAAFFRSVYTDYKKNMVNYRYVEKNTTNMSAKAMFQLLQKNKVSMSSEGHVTLIKNDVTYEYGGISSGGGTNMVGLIALSIAFGVVLNTIKKNGLPLVNLFRSLWHTIMKLVEIIMWLAPIGICSIIAGNIVEASDITLLFRALGLYALTNIVGHLIQGIIIYPVLYVALVRANPITHLKGILPALFTAFGTSSSAATLPTTIECCESKVKIDKRVTRFVLPIGATCNMDGAALYYAIVVLFVEQMEPNVQLEIGERIMTVLIATVVSIGAAGIPSAGLANVVVVLKAVGLPVDKIGPIFAVEWFIDRLRTVINVMGDTVTAAVVAKYSQNDFAEDNFQSLEVCKNLPGETSPESEETIL
ncbi:excitatory amino acid transporter 1-like [Dendronephthya gigantea]|uniref:excitatory amino acid transporter 1-like n=1 Tax=Dendronephthya gigantea TaxID=151771 RepID=UPI001069435C|nr:excitatory amino acid transporter 1-like [Dendronephthya gigantea]